MVIKNKLSQSQARVSKHALTIGIKTEMTCRAVPKLLSEVIHQTVSKVKQFILQDTRILCQWSYR